MMCHSIPVAISTMSRWADRLGDAARYQVVIDYAFSKVIKICDYCLNDGGRAATVSARLHAGFASDREQLAQKFFDVFRPSGFDSVIGTSHNLQTSTPV